MNKIFVRVYTAFIVGLTVIGIVMLMASKQPDKTEAVQKNPIHSEEAPKDNPMIVIPAGDFMMGSDNGGVDEQPKRMVFLDTYAIHQFEVMYHEYGEFVAATGHREPLNRYVKDIQFFNHPNQPAIYVSWLDAYEYCKWRGFRLPSEAEWEKAARGAEGLEWPWVEKFEPTFANFKGEADLGVFTMTVGSYEKDKSPYGIYDMSGNIREWVQDWYDDQYYGNAPQKNPLGPERGEMKVLRGSSWRDSLYSGRTTGRLKMIPGYRYEAVGFRCARTVVDIGEGF